MQEILLFLLIKYGSVIYRPCRRTIIVSQDHHTRKWCQVWWPDAAISPFRVSAFSTLNFRQGLILLSAFDNFRIKFLLVESFVSSPVLNGKRINSWKQIQINHNKINLIKFANFINKKKFNLNYEQENRWAQIILAQNY